MKNNKQHSKYCQSCGKEIMPGMKNCPNCGKKIKKPIYKKVWFWILIAFFVIGVVSSAGSNNTESSKKKEETSVTQDKDDKSNLTKSKEKETAKPKETTSQKNAVKKAKSYLKYDAFSRKGLIEQLEFEGFSNEDATYGVDSCDVDWN